PFVAQYAAEFGNATCPAIEETKMTELSRFRWGSAAWVSAYGARTFTRHCMSKSSSGAPPNGVGQKIPAECTTESIEPKAERDSETIRAGASSETRSTATERVSPAQASLQRRSRSSSRPVSTTLAPASDIASAIAEPMPELAPVTIATLPSRLKLG